MSVRLRRQGLVAAAKDDLYAARGLRSEYVADFINDLYRIDRVYKDFDTALTYAGLTAPATMTDSDGLRKWSAHNLLTYSEDFANAAWDDTTATAGHSKTETDPFGNANQAWSISDVSGLGGVGLRNAITVTANTELYTFSVWVKKTVSATNFPGIGFIIGGSFRIAIIDTDNGTGLVRTGDTIETLVVEDAGTFWLVSVSVFNTSSTTIEGVVYGAINSDASATSDSAATGSAVFWGPHLYNASLDMVNNPDRDDTYVPTTTAAVYLPRRNAHLYDASVAKWNAHNLVTYSEDFTSGWTARFGTPIVTTNTIEDNDGGENEGLGSQIFDVVSGVEYTTEIDITYDAVPATTRSILLQLEQSGFDDCAVDTSTGEVRNIPGRPFDSVASADNFDGTFTVTLVWTSSQSTARVNLYPAISNATLATMDTGSYSVGLLGSVTASKVRTYRSDLNGVVANGDDGTYVATTATAVLPTINTASVYPKKGMRLESAAATNLLIDSNDFGTAAWAKVGTDSVTLTAAAAIGADGASSLTEVAITDTTNEDHGIFETLTVTTNITHCTSIDVRDNDQRYITLRHYRSTNNWSAIVVDLDTGTITQSSTGATTGTIVFSAVEALAAGLWRIHLASNEAGTTLNPALDFVSSSTPTLGTDGGDPFVGVAGVGVYIGAAQTVAGASPPNYIPTDGATVARAAETLEIAGADTPANTTAMSTYVKLLMTYADEGTAAQMRLFRWRTDADNNISHEIDTNAADTGEVNIDQIGGGTATIKNAATQYSPGVNVQYSVASRHLPLVINVAKDGTAETESVRTGTIPDLSATAALLGHTVDGFLQEVIIWGVDITDAGIEEASS